MWALLPFVQLSLSVETEELLPSSATHKHQSASFLANLWLRSSYSCASLFCSFWGLDAPCLLKPGY